MQRTLVIVGWVTILFVAGLLSIYQSLSYFEPALLCRSESSCLFLATLVYRICLGGMTLGIFLVLPSALKLSAASVLVTLVVVEAAYRIHDSYLNHRYPKNEEEEVSPIPTYDAVLGWKMKSNIETFFTSKANRFRTKVKVNSKGLRDDDYEYRKPQDVKRVLLLGDSVVAGLEVENDQVLDKRLELLLNREGKYQVINAGVRGYGTDQQYLFFKNEGYKYSPDIVIYVFVNNDPMENVTIHKPDRRFGKAYFKPAADELVLNGIPVPEKFSPNHRWLMSDPYVEEAYNKAEERSVRRSSFVRTIRDEVTRFHVLNQVWNSVEYGTIRASLESFGFVDRLYGMGGMWPYREPKPQFVEDYEWDMTERLLVKMSQLSGSLNAKLIVYESSSSGSHNTARTRLDIISTKHDILYFNSFEEMYVASNGARKFSFPLDVHWNALGHEFVATAMYQFLLRNGFLQDNAL